MFLKLFRQHESMKTIIRSLLATGVVLLAGNLWAGPPLICHEVEIGGARSLPWKSGPNWNGADPAYKVANLSRDTLALLTPATPVNVRMETLRRAAIYAASEPRRAEELTSRLLARTLDAEASGKADALAWFDAGYFVETLRQATFVYRYDMLSAKEKAEWKLRGEGASLDGYAWVQKAIRLGGKDMERAASLMVEYRNADLQARASK